MLQPLAGVFALRSVGERRVLPALSVVTTVIFMPALLALYVHEALSAHFLLLLALGLYFRLTSAGGRPVLIGRFSLVLLSFLIHPYLLFMMTASLAAAPLSLFLRGDIRWCPTSLVVGMSFIAVAAMAWVAGYAGAPDPGSFGQYRMNLLAPVVPIGSTIFPFSGRVAVPEGRWWEGCNYLVAGVLLVLAAAIWLQLRHGTDIWRLVRRHAGLLLATAFMSIFAFPSWVYLGSHFVADLGPVPSWLQQVRVTGRFFWPATYLIVVAGTYLLVRSTLPRCSHYPGCGSSSSNPGYGALACRPATGACQPTTMDSGRPFYHDPQLTKLRCSPLSGRFRSTRCIPPATPPPDAPMIRSTVNLERPIRSPPARADSTK